MRYRNVFTITFTADGPVADAFHVFDMEALLPAMARVRLGLEASPELRQAEERFRAIATRGRFASGGGPFLLYSHVPLVREGVDDILQDYHRQGDLGDFLRRARI